MNDKKIFRYITFTILSLTVLFLMMASPALAFSPMAAGLFQVTPPPVDDDPIVIIPETGEQTNIFLDNWFLFAILGIILLVLLVALVARGGTTHHH
jgi:surface polysaccharide O-acyltransferase-like enzyme